MITIDGSYGEGAGALLRTALSLSALTQQDVRIEHIRGGSKFSGLDVEDLVLIEALERICQADVVGANPGSNELTFLPKSRPKGVNRSLEPLRGDNGRGPNALVVLGTLIPLLARTGVYSTLNAEGETFGFNALSYDYFSLVTLEALKKIGIFAVADLLRPGFGRSSDGEVRLEIEPSATHGIEWSDRGPLRSVQAIVTTAGLPSAVGERVQSHLKNLASNVGLKLQAETIEYTGRNPGVYVTCWAVYDRGLGGGVAMGARGVKAETLAQTAFDQLLRFMSSNATVDEFLADQILLPLAFAEGSSLFSVPRLTPRLLTAIWVIKQFVPLHVTVRGAEGGPGTISIRH